MKKFFQVPGPRGKLGIFPSPRAFEKARNFYKSQKYEENMKEYEQDMTKYKEICGKYENKDSPYIWAVGLRKISSSSSYLEGGGEGGFEISRFRGTQAKRHETCQKGVSRWGG